MIDGKLVAQIVLLLFYIHITISAYKNRGPKTSHIVFILIMFWALLVLAGSFSEILSVLNIVELKQAT